MFVAQPGFLLCNALTNIERLRIVRDDLTIDPVLQRRNDTSPVGIIFRIGRENELHVEQQTDLKSADLDVAFLKDVEQRYLYARLEIGQLIDHKDTSVRTGY